MRHHVLSAGTVLDGRYRIEALLGEGGFGITYAATNARLGMKVAVKELFWRGHSVRDAADSPEVALEKTEDVGVFEAQKRRFLSEARMLRDFSGQADIARVLDYFEANGTAYIVMEFVEGETLAAHLAGRGPLPVEETFRRFLPLIESLAAIHDRGVIHRDISPENIMVQPDGRLKLIDFGAARAYAGGDSHYTAVLKDSYAPSEQYDKNGRQGPWSDVYSLCATLYACVTGQPPLSAVQRMFVDELQRPSRLRPELDARFEAILLRGLELSASRRYQSMNELARAVRAALPAPRQRSHYRYALLGLGLGFFLIALALGLFFQQRSAQEGRFEGAVTETFFLTAPADMSAREFAQAQGALREAMDRFAGADGYLLSVEDTRLRVELPLACFGGRDIAEALREALAPLFEDRGLTLSYQIQVEWEDPGSAANPGKNQIEPRDFSGETAIFCYETTHPLTAGQRASSIVNFKLRLDALGAPYAFGCAYGNPDALVFRIDPARIGRCVTETLGGYGLELAGECSSLSVSLYCNGTDSPDALRVVETGDGVLGLRCEFRDPQPLRQLTEALLNDGQRTLYLQSRASGAGLSRVPIARLELDAPIEDGVAEFHGFMFEGAEQIGPERRGILDYFTVLVGETSLPEIFVSSGEGIWDAEGEGKLLFDAPVAERLGLPALPKDGELRLREMMAQIDAEADWSCGTTGNSCVVFLNLRRDEHFVEGVAAGVEALLKKYPLGALHTDLWVTICPTEEVGAERYRISLYSMYDYEEHKFYTAASAFFGDIESNGSVPYSGALDEWWSAFPAQRYELTQT